MKIALLSIFKEERWTSIDVYTSRILEGVRNIEPAIDIFKVQPEPWNWPDIKVKMPYGRPASIATLGLYLSRWILYPLLIRRVEADIYHIIDNSYGHLAYFLNPQKVIITSHGGTPQKWRKWNPEGPAMWIFDMAFRGILRASRIITVSDYAKNELLGETSFPGEKISTIYHGVDSRFCQLSADIGKAIRSRLLNTGEKYILLHVGHSAPRKNLETLYQALAILRKEGLPVRLVRIGKEPSPSQITLINQLDIAPFITHLPPMPNDQLPPFYNAADVFLFPSYYEGFGIPLIEAMACGTPVVCSDIELFHEICDLSAFYADPNHPESFAFSAHSILSDASLSARLKNLGLNQAKKFTWETSISKLIEIYKQVYESSKNPL